MIRTVKEALPPYSTCRVCKNKLTDVCCEVCAVNRDYSWFEFKEGVNLEDLPLFPFEDFTKDMQPTVRMIVVAIYLSKFIELLKGFADERPIVDPPRSGQIFKDFEIQSLHVNPEEEDPIRKNGKKRPGENE